MTDLLLSRRDLDFLLYEWLEVDALIARPRFANHSRDTFDAALSLFESLAEEDFYPHNQINDSHEPQLVNGRIVVRAEVGKAIATFCNSGLIAASLEENLGGMQLPYVLERAGMAYMFAANPGTIAYPFLTMANANLLLTHGSARQIDDYVRPMLAGRYFGTMCLSEPHAGSSLAEIKTKAVTDSGDQYRLFGSKMWISGGDHEISENIIHLVLAKIVNERGETEAGVQGISLFIVPKQLTKAQSKNQTRNDISTLSLNHKMGFRGTTNCALNFGSGEFLPDGQPGAVGFLLGEAGKGLAYMFQMMNEARIGIGLAAAAIGYTGYLHSLEYARHRVQGHPPARRSDGDSPPVRIIEHCDVRRMLLAQKAYAEGALALALYSALLVDECRTAESLEDRQSASSLLDLLTPVTKSWPSEWCVASNDLAIQVHGGYGYARDYRVEQFYRDNRLNPIHEGTQGIQALDLLGRKVRLLAGTGLAKLMSLIGKTADRGREISELIGFSAELLAARTRVEDVTRSLARIDDSEVKLANATAYMQAFGHLVVAWLWLSQAIKAHEGLCSAPSDGDESFYRGKIQACSYFYRWELPRLYSLLALLDPVDRTCLDMADAWF